MMSRLETPQGDEGWVNGCTGTEMGDVLLQDAEGGEGLGLGEVARAERCRSSCGAANQSTNLELFHLRVGVGISAALI